LPASALKVATEATAMSAHNPVTRIPVVRASSTRRQYLKGGSLLLERALNNAPTACDSVEALLILFNDKAWVLRASTTRLYKQQVLAILAWEFRTGKLDEQRFRTGSAELAEVIKARRGHPPKRTSAKKLKKASYDEYRRILGDFMRRCTSLDRAGRVLGLLLRVSPFVGLRPKEWLNASVSGDRLIVANAKHGNGRAPGPTRIISLKDVPQPIISVVGDLIAEMRQLVGEPSNWVKVLKLLGERLARVCKRLEIERWSLTSLRHVAQSTWKRAGLSPAQIAALSGHSSTATSRRHYAGRRHGWPARFACALPAEGLVAHKAPRPVNANLYRPEDPTPAAIEGRVPHDFQEAESFAFHPKH
jgi:hypothetical protein